MQVSNGTVSRVLRLGDYENRTVTLSFTIEEGDDAAMATANVVAMVERLVTQKAAVPVREVKPPVVVQEPTATANPTAMAVVPNATPPFVSNGLGSNVPGVATGSIIDEKPITDQHLTDCINAALGRGVAGPDIRKTVDKVTGIVGSSVYSLADRAKRQEALDVIGAMGKVAAEPVDAIQY